MFNAVKTEKRRKRMHDIGGEIDDEASYENEMSIKLAYKGKDMMDSFVSKRKPKMQTTLNQM